MDFFVAATRFIYLFWALVKSVTLSTKTHCHYSESVHCEKQHASSIHIIQSKIMPLFKFTFAKRGALGPHYVYSLGIR